MVKFVLASICRKSFIFEGSLIHLASDPGNILGEDCSVAVRYKIEFLRRGTTWVTGSP